MAVEEVGVVTQPLRMLRYFPRRRWAGFCTRPVLKGLGWLLVAGVVSTTGSACEARDTAPSAGGTTVLGPLTTLPSPAPVGSNTPSLVVASDGRVLLSWTERGADSAVAIRMATWRGTGWDSTRTIAADRPFFVNWADFPAVTVLGNGDLAAHWLEREDTGKYAYGIRTVRSRDDGRTWGAPATPHTDGLPAEHGFVSLWPEGGQQLGLVWLDGRKSAMPDSAREMTLRTAVVRDDGSLASEFVLDARTCDCCQTATARTSTGQVIVYRDRSAGDIRDITIVRQLVGGWSPPVTVHDDGWYYPGCPVNGPSVAARGSTVVVAWFTAAHDTARVLAARSTDGGATFEAPVQIDDGDPVGRVSVILDAASQPVIAWLEQRSSTDAEVLVRRLQNGTLGETRVVSRTSGARQSGFPRLAVVGDTLYAAWTSVSPSLQVHIGRLSLSPSVP